MLITPTLSKRRGIYFQFAGPTCIGPRFFEGGTGFHFNTKWGPYLKGSLPSKENYFVLNPLVGYNFSKDRDERERYVSAGAYVTIAPIKSSIDYYIVLEYLKEVGIYKEKGFRFGIRFWRELGFELNYVDLIHKEVQLLVSWDLKYFISNLIHTDRALGM